MIEVPDNVLANWRAWFPGRERELVVDIRTRYAAAVDAWQLSRLTPLTGGAVAFVFAARCGTRDVVLKLNPRVELLGAEGPALALWAARHVSPEVWGTRDDGLTLLLQRVRPGVSLRDTGAGALEIVETIGALCPSVHLEGPSGFPSLAEAGRDDGWLDALAGRREHDELLALLEPTGGERLLHTDLHWLNVLRGPDGWLVIDPKPVVGDPHAEVFVFFDGPPVSEIPDHPAAAREHVDRLVGAYASASGLDGDRLRAWIRVRALAAFGDADGLPGWRAAGLARLMEACG